jgi:hypothetical protein
VPYSPYLSAKFDCHINVECAATVKSIKYPFKYIHKGGDRATMEIDHDEIKTYIDGRYIGPSESAWRIFQFDLHKQVPNIVRLPVHLAGQHMVTFDGGEDPEEVLQRAASEVSKLQAFFAANRDEGALGQAARKYTYQEFPQYFVWKDQAKPPRWGIRQKGFALGRMYFVSPSGGERFYLRTLLTIVKGPRSHNDLYCYQGEIPVLFKTANLTQFKVFVMSLIAKPAWPVVFYRTMVNGAFAFPRLPRCKQALDCAVCLPLSFSFAAQMIH